MKEILKFVVLTTAIFLGLVTYVNADVSYNPETRTMEISGPTDTDLVVKASNVLREEEVERIFMWGPGGFFEMSLQLGHRIKKEGVEVIIPAGKYCISACAFAALGAEKITVDGTIMFHRPYLNYVPTFDNIESIIAHGGKAYIKMARYAEDMGYERRLVDNIITYSTPCKFLSWSELTITPPKIVLWSIDDRCGNRYGFIR